MARILIIDDNLDMIRLLETLLRSRGGHEVITSNDGQDGVEKAFAQQPDVIIADVMMPKMNGYEVVRKLRADARTANAGIIILTARGQPVDRLASLEAGADEYMTKPASIDDLLEKVTALTNRAPTPPPGKGLIISLLSMRGGTGVTTLAVNMAAMLRRGTETVLFDLSPRGGHCALYLGLRPDRHWGLLLQKPDLKTEDLLLQHPSGLKLLAAPTAPVRGGWFSEEQLDNTLNSLRSLARFIIVDMPPVLNPIALKVLEASHRILVIGADDPPGLQSILGTYQTLQDMQDKMLVVLNGANAGPRPPIEAVERALHISIAGDLPFDPAQANAMRRSLPLAFAQPEPPLIVALKKIAVMAVQPRPTTKA